jgi:hypothetical protein
VFLWFLFLMLVILKKLIRNRFSCACVPAGWVSWFSPLARHFGMVTKRDRDAKRQEVVGSVGVEQRNMTTGLKTNNVP